MLLFLKIILLLFGSGQIIANDSIKEIISEPKSNSQDILYLRKKYSFEDYKSIKEDEIEKFKKLNLEFYKKVKFNYSYTKYFNIAYACSNSDFNILFNKMKVFFYDTYPKYFHLEPRFTVRVVLFKNKSEFEREMEAGGSYGFYFPEEKYWTPTAKTFFSYCGSGPGTAWHEMIHPFVDFFAKDSQQWFNEGFASFYEMGSTTEKNFIEGFTNWRHPELQEVIRSKKLTPLKKFLLEENMREDYGYAYARFFFCYLWTKNLMIPFVKEYIFELYPNFKGKKLGEKTIETLERLTNKKIDDIQIELESLALKLKKYEKLKQSK
jgi:hypothetical protein